MSTTIVVTTINRPTKCLRLFAEKAEEYGVKIVVAGDRKTPTDFSLRNCEFHSFDGQVAEFPRMGALAPANSYGRKNFGYLAAIRDGAEIIVDTDDDNAPLPRFWEKRAENVNARLVSHRGWVNAYSYFSDAKIWPRGFPLRAVGSAEATAPAPAVAMEPYACPIQQGLADDNPDVDAVYRLLFPLPVKFKSGKPIALDFGAWCPFNSQNTSWWPEAYHLLYLPSYCSFRMTDIWRSFVAQRIMWENGWRLSFAEATVYQDRNEHDLLKDFKDEIAGYLHNESIVDRLMSVDIIKGKTNLGENMVRCYGALVDLGVIGPQEMELLTAWIYELEAASSRS